MGRLALKLTNGRLATSGGVWPVDVGIRDGRIAAIGAWGSLPEADEVIDVADRVVLPGGVDLHLHAGDPGMADFGNATAAAALGAVTTVVDMPIQIPRTTDAATYRSKLDVIAAKAHVDFALWATVEPGGVGKIPELKRCGAAGIKLVMQRSVEGLMPLHGDGELFEALQRCRAEGLPAVIHAENQDMIAHLEEALSRAGREDPRAFLECHPPITELEAIHRVLFLGERAGAHVHIAHCSLAEGIDMVDAARGRGQSVSVETCPHYLMLDESIFDTRGTLAKLSPALRRRSDVDAMWERLREGRLDAIASDHAPFPLAMKRGTIWEASAGIPGVQTMFPLVLREGVARRRIPLPRLVYAMSEGPARVAGLHPRKGSVQVGADADLAVFDLDREQRVALEEQVGVEWSLYEGARVSYPERVLVRGETVAREGRVTAKPGQGRPAPAGGAPTSFPVAATGSSPAAGRSTA